MRITKLYFGLALFVFFALLAWSFSYATERPDKDKSGRVSSVQGTTGLPRWQILNINNLTTWVRSDGEGNHTPTGDNGVYFPIGTGNVVYEDNTVFGGIMYRDAAKTQKPTIQPVRINGGSYLSNHGMSAGWVTGLGATAVAVDPGDPAVRCYRIRRDYTAMSQTELRADAQTSYELSSPNDVSDAQVSAILDQYAKDWKEWPVSRGAPYVERNGQPGYQAPPDFSATFGRDDLISGHYDEPGVAGANPETPADQVLFLVYNGLDRSKTIVFEASEPMGLEIQKTVWGYKRSDALGNLYFTRYRIINKGGIDVGGGTKGAFYIDSMFVDQWSDIDLGNAGDDLAGCDSTLSMAFVYNGAAVDNTFIRFGLPPPASGYDFLAGPLVSAPGDSGVFDFKRVRGKKNLGMSSFAYFSAGSQYTDPGFANYSFGTGQWWHMLRGFAPIGAITDAPTPYLFPPGLTPSKFPLSGNPALPASSTNFIDGLGALYSFAPGDRRILLNTGPFTMAPGDTQDVYMGFVVGLGGDRLSSVAVMKANDKAVQSTFDILFQVASPPSNATVKVTELDGELILEWGSDFAKVSDTETKIKNPGNYQFQGYNLYQFPSAGASLSSAKRLDTYDVVDGVKVIFDNVFDIPGGRFVDKPIQFGSDKGVKRFYRVTRDAIRDIDKLYNGQEYYFAVTAYSYTDVVGYSHSLESSPNIVTVKPKVPFGTQLNSVFGDTVKVARTLGVSDGHAEAYVVDPTALTGDSYQIKFDSAGTWRVFNVTKNKNVATGQTNQGGGENYPIVDGVLVKVFGAPNDSKDFLHVAGPSGALTQSYAAFTTFNSWGFPNASGVAALDLNGGGPSIGDWGGGRWGIHTGGSGAGDESYTGRFVPRVFRGTNFSRFVPYDFEIRFTAAGGKAYLGFTTGSVVNVPFELWNIGSGTPADPSDDFRMIPWVNDADANEKFNLQQTDHGLSGGDNDPYTDWIYWYEPNNKSPGQAGYLTEFANKGAAYDTDPIQDDHFAHEVMARVVLVNVNGGSVSAPTWPANATSIMPATGNVIRILSTKPNNPLVTYAYSTSGLSATTSAQLAKKSAEKVGVFPNPYYAFNAAEVSRFNRFVTFNNLPPAATLRIFNLAGQLVRTLRKSDPSQFLRWDLLNDSNFPVASGLYIVQVEMTAVGVTKILKLAIIQEQEVLDIF